MKRILALLTALIMLCSACCTAQENMSTEESAKYLISAINYLVNEYTGAEQLFIGYDEVLDDEIYGFYTADDSLHALVAGNAGDNSIAHCSFICDDTDTMMLAVNCSSLMPLIQLMMGEDDSIAGAIQDDMLAMADWLNENHAAALYAFENGVSYNISYLESEYFHLEMMIVPMEDGVRMMAKYYFGSAGAGE